MAKFGKRMKNALAAVDLTKAYTLAEAVKLVKANAKAKFDETIDVAIMLGIDVRQADQQVRGMLELPHGTGKSVRVAVFARGDKAVEAKKAGADIVGAEDLMEQILAGSMPFDRVIATPDMMPIVGRLGKVLGPKGMMPNPKLGTVTADIAKAVEANKGGSIEYRAEKTGIVHCGVGKASFTEAQLNDNVKALLDTLMKIKPSGAKGTYMKKISISSTMGPGLMIDVASLAA